MNVTDGDRCDSFAPVNPRPLVTPALVALEQALSPHPRLHGYYLLKILTFDKLAEDCRNEATLGEVFELLDDKPWRPLADRPTGQSWADHRVDADLARAEVVTALIGGNDVGHTSNTMERDEAEAAWSLFEAEFGLCRDYYIRLGFGKSEYVFQRGVVIVAGKRAGALFVVEND
jgi:hypothetical protein